MNCPSLVCPYEPDLLERLTGRVLALRVDSPGALAGAVGHARRAGHQVDCVIVETAGPLDAFPFQEDWAGIPLALFAPEFGHFRNMARHMPVMRKLDLRVYLPADRPANVSGLRILSSLGVASCAVLHCAQVDWEAIADLMTYAVLGRVPHAPIEPFTWIARHYDPAGYTDWGALYFDDPKAFLHVDAAGRVALSGNELRQGIFVADDIGVIGDPRDILGYSERLDDWRRFFLDNHSCARCASWRVCLGRFARDSAEGGCDAFFAEMMAVAEQFRQQQHDAANSKSEPGRWSQ